MRRVLDFLFPLECVACGAPGEHACRSCLAELALAPRVFEDRGVRAAAGFAYAQPLVRRLLHDAKYETWSCALPPLETLMRRWAAKASALFPPDALVVPVPLHPSRMRQRGFNQAETLARALAAATGRHLAPGLLVRTRATRPQTEAQDRSLNVRRSFAARTPSVVRSHAVIVVDDVRTSGATLAECAAALRTAGSVPVYGFALAWGSGLPKEDEKT